jgi:hypothetical protein
LSREVWKAPQAYDRCFIHRTGDKFTLRKVPPQPEPPLVFEAGRHASNAGIARQIEAEFGTNSGPFRRVLSRPPSTKRPGFSWMSTSVHLPGAIDLAEQGDDTACVYTGGWGGRGGAVDAGFVHSRTRHNWSLFVRREVPVTSSKQPTGQTFSLLKRFKEDQDVRLTLSVPADDTVAITAVGVDLSGKPLKRTVMVAMDPQFEWRADGRANILKRITTIAQNKEDFSRAEKIVGVHWFSPTATSGPCRIGWNWRNNHDWSTSDTAQKPWLGSYETWPMLYDFRPVVYSAIVSPGEETDAIILAGIHGK